MSVRKKLYDHEADYLGKPRNKKQPGRNQANYRISKKQWQEICRLRKAPNVREFVETIIKKDKNGNPLSTVEKLQSEPIEVPEGFELIKISTSKTTGQQWLQHAPKRSNEEDQTKEIDFESIIKKYVTPCNLKPPTELYKNSSFVDRLVYTDVHTGMNPNENGYSLYGGKWDEDEILGRLQEMIDHVLLKKDSNVLLIDELGDFMDGWDGETTRKGHHLPQNMDNEKAFDVGFHFKIRLIDSLVPYYEKIICHNICNDNHAGSFGYVVNKAFKNFIEYKYSNVEVINVRKFIDHYKYGRLVFIITHGKDGKNLKFGFKPILDPKQIEKIKNYIDEHCLLQPGTRIIFSKGDSHQDIMDNSTSDSFDYNNYPAFSPSSDWVQTNFKKGKSGFYFYNIQEDTTESIHPYYFKWDTNREEVTIDFSEFADKRIS